MEELESLLQIVEICQAVNRPLNPHSFSNMTVLDSPQVSDHRDNKVVPEVSPQMAAEPHTFLILSTGKLVPKA